ncbi:MAG: GNAT family N-acetyltransferase [Magnetospirillum sp. WYHS-4]
MQAKTLFSHDLDGIDFAKLAELFRRSRNKQRDAFDVEAAFRGSYAAVVAWEDGQVVGAVRAISDGIYFAAIVDMAVDPDHQGKGLGTALMGALLLRLPRCKVYLRGIEGTESFYQRFGFRVEEGAMGLFLDESRQAEITGLPPTP